MQLTFREARREDVPAIVAMLRDDALGAGREGEDLEPYLAAFDAMALEPGNLLIVADAGARIVGTYQLAFISGLSLRAARRAQVESVRVASDLRGQGVGRRLMADAEARARAGGCALIQLTTNRSRDKAHRFYADLGYVPSHVGMKKALDPDGAT